MRTSSGWSVSTIDRCDAVRSRLRPLAPSERAAAAYAQAAQIADEDVAINRAMGRNGLEIVSGW